MSNYTRLRPVREKLKILQADMAVLLGVSRLTYIKWEKDEREMPFGKYYQALEYLEGKSVCPHCGKSLLTPPQEVEE